MMRDIVHNEMCRQQWGALFPTNEFVLQILKNIRDRRALNGCMMQPLAHYNSVRIHFSRNKWFQGLAYSCLVSPDSKKYEEWLAMQKMHFYVTRCKLLKIIGEDGVLMFSL